MKQAAMYVRVSTRQQQEGATIESQKASLLQHAREKGFDINPEWVFEDNGVSGSKLARPALDRLRDFASEGILGHIFVMSPDRLSRKYAYQAILMDEFKANGVNIHFQNSNDPITATDHLLLQMQGMFAEYERAQITERSRRGKKHKAKNGAVSVLSRASYGYRYIRDVEGIASSFEINDREASVVQTIFELYVRKRFSIMKIKQHLSEHNVRSPTGNAEWTSSTIGGILRNSAYRGVAYFGKRENCEVTSTRLAGRSVRLYGRRVPKRATRPRDSKDWITIPVPSIINNETFEAAQELLRNNKRLSLRNAKPGSLLQGLISCKECGYGFMTTISGKKIDGYGYYRCRKIDKKCGNRGIKMEVLDEAVWGSLMSILKSPELIQAEVSRRLSDVEKAPILQHKKLLEGKLEKLDIDSNRLLDAYQNGCIELTELKIRMTKIKSEKNNISREIAGMDSGLSKKQLLELSEAITYFADHLKISCNNLGLEEKRKILRMLIQEIQIGKEDITINHIIPVKSNPSEEIACLHTSCVCASAFKMPSQAFLNAICGGMWTEHSPNQSNLYKTEIFSLVKLVQD